MTNHSSSNLLTLEQAIDYNPLTVAPEVSVMEVLRLMSRGESGNDVEGNPTREGTQPTHQASYVLVMQENPLSLLGIVTERDLVRLAATGRAIAGVTVGEIMTAPVITLKQADYENIFTVVELFRRHHIRHLPIVDEQNQLLGVVSQEGLHQKLTIAHLLKIRRVQEIMITPVIHAPPTVSIQYLTQLMAQQQVSCVVITESTADRITPLGIITERDIVQFQALGWNLATTTAQTGMSTPLLCLHAEDSLWDAHEAMEQHQVRRMVITGDTGLLGLVTQSSILRSVDPTALYGLVTTLQQVVEDQVAQLQQEIAQRQRLTESLIESEARRKTSEAFLQDVLNTTHAAIKRLRVFADHSWQADYYSAGCEVVYGYTAEEFKQNPLLWQSRVWPEDMGTVILPALSRLLTERVIKVEYRFLQRDGTLHWIEEALNSVYDAALDCWVVTIIATNVSDRKQAEAALRESEERFQQIAKNINQFFFVRSASSEEYLYASPAYERIWGRSCESLYKEPTSWLETIHPGDRQRVQNSLAQQFQGNAVQREYRILRPDGSVRWIMAQIFPVRDASGKVLRFVGLADDVTERTQAEAALAQSEAQYRLLFENNPNPMWIFDLETLAFLAVNQAAIDCYGYSRSEFLAITIADIRPVEDIAALKRNVLQAASAQGSYVGEWRHYKRNGEMIDVEISLYPIIWANKPAHFVLAKDITDRKRAEVALRKQAEQEQLLRLITQRIRQSLDLEQILATTVIEVQQTLQSDRVLIFRLHEDGSGQVIQEAVTYEYPVTDQIRWQGECFPDECYEYYRQGRPRIMADVTLDEWSACLVEFMQAVGVKSKVVAPIVQTTEDGGTRVWGLLILHACAHQRQWQQSEADFLQQISNQLAIAIHQANLYRQLQTELTERKQATAALRNSETRFRTIFADAPIGMALTTAEGQIVQVNQALCQMLGYGELELKNLMDHDVIAPEDLEHNRVLTEQLFNRELPGYKTEKRCVKRNGETVWVSVTAGLLQDPNSGTLYKLCMFENITEQRAIEQMKDNFVSVVSHELRTPLTSIRGSLGLVATGQLGTLVPEGQELLNIAVSESQRLVRLVNDILDLERLKSGHIPLVQGACQIPDLIARSVDSMRSLANEAGIKIEVAALAEVIWVDGDRVIQTLTNLLSNAIKFSGPDTTITASAELMGSAEVIHQWRLAEAGKQGDRQTNDRHFLESLRPPAALLSHDSYILFCVKDQGRGIPANKLDTIFKPFEQVDMLDANQKGGSGLGLAICQSIIQRHGGIIWAISTPGQGSSFFFTLPQFTPEEPAP